MVRYVSLGKFNDNFTQNTKYMDFGEIKFPISSSWHEQFVFSKLKIRGLFGIFPASLTQLYMILEYLYLKYSCGTLHQAPIGGVNQLFGYGTQTYLDFCFVVYFKNFYLPNYTLYWVINMSRIAMEPSTNGQ